MTTYGYARVSTTDQDLSIQREALQRAGCNMIREEKASGTKRGGRDQLQILLDFIQKGDVLVVTRLDRLGRSLRDLSNISHELTEKGASLRVLEQAVDTGTSAGNAFFGMLAVFAQFETDVRGERQREGIAKAKTEGKYLGGKQQIDRAEVWRMLSEGVSKAEIARRLDCTEMTIYRVLKEPRAQSATA